MTKPKAKKILFVCRHAPYGTSTAKDAIDALLAASAYEQDLSVLWAGDGVFQLQKDQNPNALGYKNLAAILPALPLYDIDKLYVQASALSARGLDEKSLVLPVEALSDPEIKELMAKQEALLAF